MRRPLNSICVLLGVGALLNASCRRIIAPDCNDESGVVVNVSGDVAAGSAVGLSVL